jgi:hypothetical protein
MRPGFAHLLLQLYPRAWRERYGEEFEALLLAGRDGIRDDLGAAVNVIWSAFKERIAPAPASVPGIAVVAGPGSVLALTRMPSAFLPMAMSLTALTVLGGHLMLFGIAREADEGAAAHIWQILMAGQIPILAAFAFKWLRRAPRLAAKVLLLQAGAALASLAPVFFLNL